MEKFDLIVIGCGPAGEKGAVKAAYFGHKVAVIESSSTLGGNLSSLYIQALLSSARKENKPFALFHQIKEEVSQDLDKSIRENLQRHGVELFSGKANFVNANTIEIQGDNLTQLCSDYFLIATGAGFSRSFSIDYDQEKVVDHNGLKDLKVLGNIIGIYGNSPFCLELASAVISLGKEVFLISKNPIAFFDDEIKKKLFAYMEQNCSFIESEIVDIKKADTIQVYMQDKTLEVDQFFDLSSNKGNTSLLNLKTLRIPTTNNGFIEVDENNCTSMEHIFAAGSVTGGLVQASHAMDQGRVAVAKMFRTQDIEKVSIYSPYSLFCDPEIAMVGYTEKELIQNKIPYSVGRSSYNQVAKGKLQHIELGFLKILFDPVSLKVLGIHILGNDASEIIHYGVSMLEDEKTLNDVIGQVFSYPSFHELYKYAAYDGLGNLSGYKIKKDV